MQKLNWVSWSLKIKKYLFISKLKFDLNIPDLKSLFPSNKQIDHFQWHIPWTLTFNWAIVSHCSYLIHLLRAWVKKIGILMVLFLKVTLNHYYDFSLNKICWEILNNHLANLYAFCIYQYYLCRKISQLLIISIFRTFGVY